jgi:hypothetical protein
MCGHGLRLSSSTDEKKSSANGTSTSINAARCSCAHRWQKTPRNQHQHHYFRGLEEHCIGLPDEWAYCIIWFGTGPLLLDSRFWNAGNLALYFSTHGDWCLLGFRVEAGMLSLRLCTGLQRDSFIEMLGGILIATGSLEMLRKKRVVSTLSKRCGWSCPIDTFYIMHCFSREGLLVHLIHFVIIT